MNYSIYSEIRPYITRIQRVLLDANFEGAIDADWAAFKEHARTLADRCDAIRAESKRQDKEDRRAQRPGGVR